MTNHLKRRVMFSVRKLIKDPWLCILSVRSLVLSSINTRMLKPLNGYLFLFQQFCCVFHSFKPLPEIIKDKWIPLVKLIYYQMQSQVIPWIVNKYFVTAAFLWIYFKCILLPDVYSVLWLNWYWRSKRKKIMTFKNPQRISIFPIFHYFVSNKQFSCIKSKRE